jgi:hypothetical protein
LLFERLIFLEDRSIYYSAAGVLLVVLVFGVVFDLPKWKESLKLRKVISKMQRVVNDKNRLIKLPVIKKNSGSININLLDPKELEGILNSMRKCNLTINHVTSKESYFKSKVEYCPVDIDAIGTYESVACAMQVNMNGIKVREIKIQPVQNSLVQLNINVEGVNIASR